MNPIILRHSLERELFPLLDSQWTFVDLAPFAQDKEDWTNPETGEFYPATFAWMSQLTAGRPDKIMFCLNVRFANSHFELTPSQQAIAIKFAAQSIAAQFNSFLECSCVPEVPCHEHATIKI